MDVKELIEKTLGIKVESIEEVKGKSFPLFDMVANVQGVKLTLIKDPMFVVIEGDDVYEKKMEGNFIIAEVNGKYIVVRYVGEPNIEVLRSGGQKAEEVEETNKEVEPEEEAEAQDEEIGEEGGEDGQDEGQESDPVKEIVDKIPAWADGAVVVSKEGSVAVLPIKKSTKKEGAYYASVNWKSLDVNGTEDLMNHIVMKNGKVVKANVYIGDKYINVFMGSRSSNRPRRYYSGRR